MSGKRYGGTIAKVLAYVDRLPVDASGCILWDRNRVVKGYGRANVRLPDGEWKPVLVHRLVLERTLGRPLAPGEQSLHRCDNPPCVNPEHLFAGTHQDNMADRDVKGRTVPFKSRFMADDAQRMRALYDEGLSIPAVARHYGVDPATIRFALRRHDLLPEFTRKGSRASRAVLTEQDVLDIRRLMAGGLSSRRIAALYGRPLSTIDAIRYRRSWAHLKDVPA